MKIVTTEGVFSLVFIFNVIMLAVTIRRVISLRQNKEVNTLLLSLYSPLLVFTNTDVETTHLSVWTEQSRQSQTRHLYLAGNLHSAWHHMGPDLPVI